MSKINLKTDYEDGQILHGDELNVNNNVTMLGVNDNYDRIANLGTAKADKTYVDTQLATKANTSDVTAQLNTKADTTYVNSQLATKANTSDVNAALNTKASITYVDNSVAPKANKSYVDTQLNTKASTDSVNAALSTKADKTYVDAQLNTKANSSDVTSALALKEDKTTIGNLSDLTTDVKTSIVAAINSIDVGDVAIATTTTPGIVKPDGETITIDQDGTIHSSSGGGGGGTTDYTSLSNKPQINSVELSGNKSLSDLGLMSSSDINTALNLKADKSTTYTKTESDTLLSGKQATLVSGTNIKTVNSNSLLGIGNIDTTDLVIVEPDSATANTKLLIESTDLDFQGGTEITNQYSQSTTLGYSANYVNSILPKLNTYSTSEETIIGTWIDNKPIYRKVIDYLPDETIGAVNATTNVAIRHNISNMEQLVNARLISEANGVFPSFGANASNNDIVKGAAIIQAASTTDYVVFRIINDTFGVRHYYIILEYTKTTD